MKLLQLEKSNRTTAVRTGHAERLNDVLITPDPPTEAPEHGVPCA